ncbi:hypothetical protein [Microbulbifer celer]|uniref:Uncharacterized protein n=1 Tax=Microbulbifer celer TaxID=435905 RepID=A0ABW3UDE7_9GAMM|nr:hypothetical protein [Microbulbifer celer]UFN55983.1 hypothetical protein LPW13_10370 [Microbulbifer celer]
MKKTILSLSLMLLSAGSFAETTLGLDGECNENGTYIDEVNFNGGDYVRCDLPASIVEDDTVVLAVENEDGDPIVWTLPGIVVVGNGNTQNANPATVDKTVLQIEAGAQIAGAVESNSALVISRGAQIDAQGSNLNPIVFSSLDDNMDGSGEWGGLVLAGFGESNNCPSSAGVDTCEMEGVAGGYYYGGGKYLNTSMSSGTLSYVVIAEGGHEVATASEINGLTLYTVNDSTSISNVHVHNNQDDGIEFFGGNAAVSNLWLTCNEDDSVDWDEGFQGSLTNVSILQDNGADHAFELANNPNTYGATPRAKGMVENVTLTLNKAGDSIDVPFKLKEGTDASFENVVIDSNYTGVCDDTSTAYTGGSTVFTTLEYSCSAGNANTSASMHLPASGSATGFSTASFWSAPACN